MRKTCPSCGWNNTRSSYKSGPGDFLLGLLWLDPFRCKSCNARFYRFRYAWARIAAPSMLVVVALVALGTVYLARQQREAWRKQAAQKIESINPTRLKGSSKFNSTSK